MQTASIELFSAFSNGFADFEFQISALIKMAALALSLVLNFICRVVFFRSTVLTFQTRKLIPVHAVLCITTLWSVNTAYLRLVTFDIFVQCRFLTIPSLVPCTNFKCENYNIRPLFKIILIKWKDQWKRKSDYFNRSRCHVFKNCQETCLKK